MENKNTSTLSMISLFFTCVLVITLVIAFYSSTKAGPSNKVCEKKAIEKGLEKKDKTVYEIKSSSGLGKGLTLELKDWGNTIYKVNPNNKFECIATIDSSKSDIHVENNKPVILAIKNNLNSKDEKIINFSLNLYAYAEKNTDESYDFVRLLENIAERYKLEKISDTEFKLFFDKYKNPEEEAKALKDLNGKYKLTNAKDFPSLITKDNGANWIVE